MEFTLSFPAGVDVSSCQPKRFNESVINPKCLLKVDATSFCFANNLHFSTNIIFSCKSSNYFYLRHKIYMLSKEHLVSQSIVTGLFIQIYDKVSLLVKLVNVDTRFSSNTLVFLKGYLFKIEIKLFSKFGWGFIIYMLLRISDMICSILKFLKSW